MTFSLKATNIKTFNLPVNYEQLPYQDRRLVREQYTRLQGGLCYHCKELLGGPPSTDVQTKSIMRELLPNNFFKYPVHLHHCHKTGVTIGTVHSRCNAVLWQYYGE